MFGAEREEKNSLRSIFLKIFFSFAAFQPFFLLIQNMRMSELNHYVKSGGLFLRLVTNEYDERFNTLDK